MQVCSLALANEGQVIATRINVETNRSMELINILIEEIFQEVKIPINNMSAVAISGGPGSYTGLRVGASCAKGLCYALGIPLIHISGLDGMIEGIQQRYAKKNKCLVPLIDARREEVFATVVLEGNIILNAAHYTVDEAFLHKFEAINDVLFFGTGSSKSLLQQKFPDNIFSDFIPNAEDLIIISYNKFIAQEFEDIAYYEPQYLKEVYFTKNN